MIEYELIRKRIKNVYIGVKDSKVFVKAPIRLSKARIDELVEQKSNWIKNKIIKQENIVKFDLITKDYIYILGKKINIVYKEAKKFDVILTLNKCEVYIPKSSDKNLEKINLKIQKKLKELSYEYIIPIVKKYACLTGFYPEEILIRRFKSIWGNCSSKKVIKINQKLIHYDIKLIEYVCLHEITHLKYMNHQKQFWSYIKKIMPDYKKKKKALKQ